MTRTPPHRTGTRSRPGIRFRRVSAALAMLAGSAALPLQAVNAAEKPDPASTPERLALYTMHEPKAPQDPARADRVWPMRTGEADYRIVEGEDAGQRGELTLRSVESPRSADHPGFRHARLDQHVEHIRRDDRGNLLLTRFEDIGNDMIIRFEEPLTLIRAEMQPGKPVVTRSPITLFDRDAPTVPDGTGTCTFTVTYDADQTLRVPAGKFRVRRFKVECEADVGAGGFSSTAYYYFADGVGLIAEAYAQDVSFLFFSRHFQRAIVRAEPPRCRAYLAAHPEP